jgi:hypothetical protein
MRDKPNRGLQPIRGILDQFDWDKNKYFSREFQDYGYRLAEELGDFKNKSLYIKLAKETPRKFLEDARNFVKDAYNVNNRAKLFMWKLGQLKKETKKS